MPRKNSLTRADFLRAEKARFRRERGALFILSFGTLPVHRGASLPDVTGQKTPEIKAACVVSKKTAPRAVDRNLIKRRWREAMRECLQSVPAPCALIFYAMKPANDASFTDIKSDITSLVALASSKLRSQ